MEWINRQHRTAGSASHSESIAEKITRKVRPQPQPDSARIITAAFTARGLEGCNEGDIIVVPAGAEMPPTLETNSEAYSGPVLPGTRRFDPIWYTRENMKRPEPAPPRELTVPDIKRRFSWNDEQFATAK